LCHHGPLIVMKWLAVEWRGFMGRRIWGAYYLS